METPTTIKEFRELDIDKGAIGLNWYGDEIAYFCTPVGAEIIGGLGVDGIHFCRVPSLDENMIFAVSPIPCGEHCVEPVAHDFIDFLRLVLSCRHASPIEQISWLDEMRFRQLLESDREAFIEGRDDALEKIKDSFGIEKLPDLYCYVKTIQAGFDYSSIPFSDEYYRLGGIEK